MENLIRLPVVKINPHTHFRGGKKFCPGYHQKTSVLQSLGEALDAGIDISIIKPNAPPIDTLPSLEGYKQEILEAEKAKQARYKQLMSFGITDNNLQDCYEALNDPRVVELKEYPGNPKGGSMTTGGVAVFKEETTIVGMEMVREFDKVYSAHCEDFLVVGREGYTVNSEASYAARIVNCAKKVPGVRVTICHATCKKTLDIAIAARKAGMNIAVEITPQHAMFTIDGLNWNPALKAVFYHCLNNLRTRQERDFLRWCLVNLLKIGVPIMWASDNAPHTEEEKLAGAAGIPSDQEWLPVLITLAIEIGIPSEVLSRLLSFNAADHYHIEIPREIGTYRIKQRIDRLEYNHGRVINPWLGSRLWFPVERVS